MSWTRTVLLAVGLQVALGPGCFLVTDFDDLETSRRETFEVPFEDMGEVPQFDILFVVDRPTHTLDYNGILLLDQLTHMGAMGNAGELVVPSGGGPYDAPPILHIGVISSDLGDSQAGVPGCADSSDHGVLRTELPQDAAHSHCANLDVVLGSQPFLTVEEGAVVGAPGLTVGEAVQCLVMAQMARLSTCPIKQPLRAVERALVDNRNIDNAGFVQEEGGLAVVFVSTQDDCSAVDTNLYDPTGFSPLHCLVQGHDCTLEQGAYKCSEMDNAPLVGTADFAELLRGVKGVSKVVLSVMGGAYDPAQGVAVIDNEILPSCTVDASGVTVLEALPAHRLSLVKEHFPDSSAFGEICSTTGENLFEHISAKLAAQTYYRCMPYAPVDTEPETPGMQASCTIHDLVNPGKAGGYPDGEYREGPYDECRLAGYGETCWEMMPEVSCIDGYKLVLQRDPDDPMETMDYIVEAECLVHLE